MFFLIDQMARREQEQQWRQIRSQVGPAIPWTPDIKWQPVMHIQAASYQAQVRNLFQELEPSPKQARVFAASPSGKFGYLNQILPAGYSLWTAYGRRRGQVFFDGPIVIPSLFEARLGRRSEHRWPDDPWMSITPMEMFTLRAGTRLARGHDVSWKKNVKRITLVEHSHELVGWLGPRINAYVNQSVRLDVLVGDAYQVVPELEADVALIDIFPNFGKNVETWRRNTGKCPGIKKVWIWGRGD